MYSFPLRRLCLLACLLVACSTVAPATDQLSAPADEDGVAADYFGGLRGMPTSFVLNQAGEVTYQHVGILTTADLDAHVTPLLQSQQ